MGSFSADARPLRSQIFRKYFVTISFKDQQTNLEGLNLVFNFPNISLGHSNTYIYIIFYKHNIKTHICIYIMHNVFTICDHNINGSNENCAKLSLLKSVTAVIHTYLSYHITRNLFTSGLKIYNQGWTLKNCGKLNQNL